MKKYMMLLLIVFTCAVCIGDIDSSYCHGFEYEDRIFINLMKKWYESANRQELGSVDSTVLSKTLKYYRKYSTVIDGFPKIDGPKMAHWLKARKALEDLQQYRGLGVNAKRSHYSTASELLKKYSNLDVNEHENFDSWHNGWYNRNRFYSLYGFSDLSNNKRVWYLVSQITNEVLSLYTEEIPIPNLKIECKIDSVKTKDKTITPVYENFEDYEMVLVQGGTFMMGCTQEQKRDCGDDENPIHRVTISDFYIGKYLVTQKIWRQVMGINKEPLTFQINDLPVTMLNWNDVQEFIIRLNQLTGKKYRLPTEAEWEYAARGGNKSKGYKYSGSNKIDYVGYYNNNSREEIQPVGIKNPNELWIYDMSGNVMEWVNDWYANYTAGTKMNPQGPLLGSVRTLRGGSCFTDAKSCRVSYRSNTSPDSRGSDIGFRLVLPYDVAHERGSVR